MVNTLIRAGPCKKAADGGDALQSVSQNLNTESGVPKHARWGFRLFVALVVPACLAGLPLPLGARPAGTTVPDRLTDQEFWRLSSDLSEQDGSFRSDNLVSNEVWFQYVIPDLIKSARPSGVYLGVGPEQNFTYIAAVRPSMAFIIDIRRGNLDLQLLYKALFELSPTRAAFVSRLFSRSQPGSLDERSTAAEIFDAFSHAERNEKLRDDTFHAIKQQLAGRHAWPLSGGDWSAIDSTLDAFATFGPNIHYLSTGTDTYGGARLPTYAELMTSTDGDGVPHSFLNTEETFRWIKALERRNLIVPVIGDFAGSKAIRAVGSYVKDRGATVSAFYLSNVEMYFERELTWEPFCRNVAALPLDANSVFIHSAFDGRYGHGYGLNSDLGPLLQYVDGCLRRITQSR
jgi:hypothetical protein